MSRDITHFLRERASPFTVTNHPAVWTVAESMRAMPDKFPVKNLLLFEEKGERFFLVVMKGDERLDVKKMAADLGAKKLRFASDDQLHHKLQTVAGAVSLFDIFGSDGVELILDARLVDQPELGFHPGSNDKTVLLSWSSVLALLQAQSVQYSLLSL